MVRVEENGVSFIEKNTWRWTFEKFKFTRTKRRDFFDDSKDIMTLPHIKLHAFHPLPHEKLTYRLKYSMSLFCSSCQNFSFNECWRHNRIKIERFRTLGRVLALFAYPVLEICIANEFLSDICDSVKRSSFGHYSLFLMRFSLSPWLCLFWDLTCAY